MSGEELDPASSAPTRFAYLHGFASSPASRKGIRLAAAFEERGRPFHRPDLNVPSFAELTYSGALSAVDGLDAAAGGPAPAPWGFVGSSMGGYLAARWAELHPERVARLVLLCPGFALTERWPKLIGDAGMAAWERDGAFELPDATGAPTKVHWGFIEDARRHPRAPEVSCPTVIVHGTRDVVVPIDSSRAYAEARDHVRLIEVDDAHDLGASLEMIVEEAMGFFGVD